MSGRGFGFLRRLFGQGAQPVSDDYARLIRRLDALDHTLTALANRPLTLSSQPVDIPTTQVDAAPVVSEDAQLGERLDAVQQGLAAVEKQLQRIGREQLKANALAEAQQEQARAALDSLEVAQSRRDDERDELRAQLADAQQSARLDLIRQLLPTLDGIEEALRAGEELLGQPVNQQQRQATLFERMRARQPLPTHEAVQLRGALRSWLHGLTFVHQRLLDLLATAGVQQVAALHAPFDPTLHIALQVVPISGDIAPGTVVAVLRSGYTVGERVLRHAEVAVAQEERTAGRTAV